MVTAIKANDLKEVKKLANEKNVNTINENKLHEVPILLALEHGSEEMTKLLLDNGANPNVTVFSTKIPAWMHETSAITLAVEKGYSVDTVSAMMEKAKYKEDLSIKYSFNNPVSAALKNERHDVLDILIKKFEVRVNDKDVFGRTALFNACVDKKPENVKYLLKNKAKPNIRIKSDGMSPLMAACLNDNEDIVNSLIEHGAKVSASDCVKRRPLNYAVLAGNKKIIKLIKAAKERARNELAQ